MLRELGLTVWLVVAAVNAKRQQKET